jgi:hypothetical protein
MPPRERVPRGSTPAGFRAQLLEKLRNRARQENVAVQRLQNRVAFERLLARITDDSGEWMLKGGFALELRYGWRHRPTRDVDLRTETSPTDALTRLRDALSSGQPIHHRDYFSFDLGEPGPEMQGAPGGAWRIPVTARVAGGVFATFHIDLSSGDAVVQEVVEPVARFQIVGQRLHGDTGAGKDRDTGEYVVGALDHRDDLMSRWLPV